MIEYVNNISPEEYMELRKRLAGVSSLLKKRLQELTIHIWCYVREIMAEQSALCAFFGMGNQIKRIMCYYKGAFSGECARVLR